MKPIIPTILFLLTILLNLKAQRSVCIDSIFNDSQLTNAKYISPFGGAYNTKAEWKDGYVVLNNGDTLFGEIRLHRSAIKIYFRNPEKEKKYKAYNYISFKYGDSQYFQKTLEKYPVNAKLIESGPVSLYAYEQHSWYPFFRFVHELNFYAVKNSKVYLAYRGEWTNIFVKKSWIADCFGDDADLIDKLKDEKLDYSDLVKSVKAYNCGKLQ